jgi:hypothetical protein
MKKNLFWWVSITIVLFGIFSAHEFDGRYGRSINGDGKAYYAYLPAIFIYQDPTFSFIDEVELKYYPTDKSQFKDFKNKQKNGKYVNKTFPGLSILYAPFFFLSMLVAWLGGFAVDGYSAPFQWGIAFSHVVYFFIGLRFLLSVFRQFKIVDKISYFVLFVLIFGTNISYYLIYDFSLSHIHSFFLACVFIWTLSSWIRTKKVYFAGWSAIILALIVIVRPTNALMILFIPFLVSLAGVKARILISKTQFSLKSVFPYFLGCVIILLIPLLFWKWQCGLWLVYSYNNEVFDFKNPHLYDFLFSYGKGWFLWSPAIGLFLLVGIIAFFKRSIFQGFLFLLPISVAVFVFSSWWNWWYGSGFGQRSMIEYYPFIVIGTVYFLQKTKHVKWLYLFSLPFCFLSLFQAFQVSNSILDAEKNTSEQYWTHFLQWKRDAPKVKINPTLMLLFHEKKTTKNRIKASNTYSYSVESLPLDEVKQLILKVNIGAKHGDKNLRLIVSNKEGSFYKDFFLGDFIYSEPRILEFEVSPPEGKSQVYKCYVWNGDSNSEALIRSIELKAYK